MTRYIVNRVLVFIPTMLLITVVAFGLRVLIPGGPAQALAGPNVSAESMALIEQRFGLDRPLYEQYFSWMSGMLTGDLGTSYSMGVPVSEMISGRLAASTQVLIGSLAFALLVGGGVGMFSAIRRHHTSGRLVFSLSAIGVSLPVVWIATVSVGVFAGILAWLPSGGYVPLSSSFVENFRTLLLPVVMTALPTSAVIARQVRSSMTAALESPYIRTAKAVGLSKPRMYFDIALRNALPPVITYIPFAFSVIMAELIVIDAVFVLPGLGDATIDAVESRDFATLQVIVVLFSSVVLLLSLFADVFLNVIDPRRRSVSA